jgi:hypothetical protein
MGETLPGSTTNRLFVVAAGCAAVPFQTISGDNDDCHAAVA